LGFDQVFDYEAGKIDWLAYGLPVEGEIGDAPLVINQMERQVPKCRLRDSAGEAKRHAEQFSLNLCPVVNEQDIVLGLLRKDAWEDDPTSPAEKLMESAPTTLRPYYPAKDAKELLDRKGGDAILVTSSNGKLMGVFKRR
jgi:predicted transcriptional regulator